MFKNSCKIVFTSAVVVSPDPVSPTASTSPTMKTPENTEWDAGDIQFKFPFD